MKCIAHQGRRATDDPALVVVLRAVAGADELVLGAVPRHDAPQVGADGVDAVGGQRLVLLHHQVRRVALEPLRQRPVVGAVGLEPLVHLDVVAQLVLGERPAAGAAGPANYYPLSCWPAGDRQD